MLSDNPCPTANFSCKMFARRKIEMEILFFADAEVMEIPKETDETSQNSSTVEVMEIPKDADETSQDSSAVASEDDSSPPQDVPLDDTPSTEEDDLPLVILPSGGGDVNVSIEELPSSGIKLPAKKLKKKARKEEASFSSLLSSHSSLTPSSVSSSDLDSILSSMDDDIPTLDKKKRKRNGRKPTGNSPRGFPVIHIIEVRFMK